MPRTRTVVVAVLLLVGVRAEALPPSADLDSWNENANAADQNVATEAGKKKFEERKRGRATWNCYNYAVDKKTFDGAGDPVCANPGKGTAWPDLGKNITAADMCKKAADRAVKDGLKKIAWNVGDAIPTPPANHNLVGLGAKAGPKGGGGDFHWWRLNGDGSWSHKRGKTKAKTTYTDGASTEQALTDPRQAAQRDGYDLCGFMGVPKNGGGANVGPLALAPVCRPRENAVYVAALQPSGLETPEDMLDAAQISQLQTHLPTFSAGNEVPNPNWPGVPAGQPAGFLVWAGIDGQGSIPPYMVVRDGVVEVVFAYPDTRADVYYADDNGLEDFLEAELASQPQGACCHGAGCVGEHDVCTCTDLAVGSYLGDATTCDGEGGSCSQVAADADHYVCYNSATSEKALPMVTLVDQFESADFQPKRCHPKSFCAPADKNGEGVTDAVTHLKAYKIRRLGKAPEPHVTVDVTNQLGSVRVETRKADRLLVPSAKSLVGPPAPPDPQLPGHQHYKCYRVRVVGTPFTPVTAGAADQFGTRALAIRKPVSLCNPASKNGSAVQDPNRHLLCYAVRPAVEGASLVYVNNQFGPHTMKLNREGSFCVPSLKVIVGGSTTTSTPTTSTTTTTGGSPSGAFLSPR